MEYQIMEIDHNCINKQIMKKIRKHIAPAVKYPIAAGIILALLLGIYGFFHNLPNFILFFLLIILFLFYYYFLLNLSVKTTFLQKKVFSKNNFLEYKLIFDEEKIVYINKNINISVKYAQIEKIIRTADEYIFITKYKRYFICQKKNMNKNYMDNIEKLANNFSIPLKIRDK